MIEILSLQDLLWWIIHMTQVSFRSTHDVLVDVTVINDRDPVPAGFTVVDYTHDSGKFP